MDGLLTACVLGVFVCFLVLGGAWVFGGLEFMTHADQAQQDGYSGAIVELPCLLCSEDTANVDDYSNNKTWLVFESWGAAYGADLLCIIPGFLVLGFGLMGLAMLTGDGGR